MLDTHSYSGANTGGGTLSQCRAIGSNASQWSMSVVMAIILLLPGCTKSSGNTQPRSLEIEQNWQLQPGDSVAGHRITGGLGDISIALNGANVYAPFPGNVQLYKSDYCVLFSSPQIPAYLLRLCGLQHPKLGDVQQGEVIGQSDSLQFAALRRQPNGKWTMVEPSRSVLERTLR